MEKIKEGQIKSALDRRARNRKRTLRWSHLGKELSFTPGYLLTAIWVAFTVMAVGWIICASLITTKEIFQGAALKTFFERLTSGFALQFENYATAWKSGNLSGAFLNSVLYCAVSCTVIILFSSPAAYVLSRFKFRGNALIQNLISVALGIPIILVIIPLFFMATKLKLTDSSFTLVFLYIALNVPFTTFFMMPFFKNLPSALEEAASIDGCGPMQTFWRVMFPLAQPGIITVTVFNFITIWNEYFMSSIFGKDKDIQPIAVALFNAGQSMRYSGKWGALYATIVIVFIPTFILYLVLSNKIIAGVTGGAIKG